MNFFRALFRRSKLDREMDDELRFHIEEQTRRNVASGMSLREATRAARKQFGWKDRIREETREARGWMWLDDLIRDVRYGARTLVRKPGFLAMAVLTFALGIGANTAIFSVLNGVLLKPLQVTEPDRLVTLFETNLARDVTKFSVSYPNFRDWRERSHSWAQLAAFDFRAINFLAQDEPRRVVARYQTSNTFSTLGIKIARGRDFAAGEDVEGGPTVVVLADRFWRRAFGANPEVIGKVITLAGKPYSVIGVAEPVTPLESTVDVFLPLGPIIEPDRTDHGLNVVGRLGDGVTLAQAASEMHAIARGIEGEHPDENAGWNVRLEPLFDTIVSHQFRTVLYVLSAAVCLLLLIACANVSGLLLVRASTRMRELAIRAALGGARGRLIRQLTTESVLLAFVGGGIGMLLATWGVAVIRGLDSADLPRMTEIVLDTRVMLFGWAVSLVTGVFAGLLPAFSASRVDVLHVLKEGTNPGRSRRRLHSSLIVGQVAVAIVLLSGAGLMVRTLDQLRRTHLGFETKSILTLRISPNDDPKAFFTALTDRIEALPGVAAVGLTNSPPMADYNTSLNVFAVGPSRIAPTESIQSEWRLVNDEYFRAMGIPVIQGRVFTKADDGQARRSVVVNQTLSRMLWGDANPIGREINPGGGTTYSTVIGMVGDIRSRDPAVAPTPGYYMSAHRFIWGPMTFAVRARTQPGEDADVSRLLPLIRAEVHALDPTLPIFAIETMSGLVDHRLATERLTTGLLGGFALLALILASVGLYGVLAFATEQRTHEVGIRMALGARRIDVVGPIVRDGIRLVVTGLVIGLAVALGVTQLLRSLLTDVSPLDPPAYIGAVVLLGAVSLVACWLPARRAAKVDPMTALRAE